LASALIEYQTASGGLTKTLRALSDDLAAFAPDPPPVPARFAELVGIGEQVEGARFAEWVARLPIARATTGDEALRRVLKLARAAAADSGSAGSRSRRRRRRRLGGHGQLNSSSQQGKCLRQRSCTPNGFRP
jgi:hypothetical protein